MLGEPRRQRQKCTPSGHTERKYLKKNGKTRYEIVICLIFHAIIKHWRQRFLYLNRFTKITTVDNSNWWLMGAIDWFMTKQYLSSAGFSDALRLSNPERSQNKRSGSERKDTVASGDALRAHSSGLSPLKVQGGSTSRGRRGKAAVVHSGTEGECRHRYFVSCM